MGGGGDVEEGDLEVAAGEEVEDGGGEDAGVDHGGFAGFEPDFVEIVALIGLADEADEEIAVVVWFGDPMTAAHVQVAEPG